MTFILNTKSPRTLSDDELTTEIKSLETTVTTAIAQMGNRRDASKITLWEGDPGEKAQKLGDIVDRLNDLRDEWGDRPAGTGIAPDNGKWQHPDDVSVLAPEQKLADWLPQAREPLSLVKYLKGVATGDWTGADAERKAMAEGSLAGGGYMVPAPLSARVIDAARAAASVFRAGAQTVPMTSSTLRIARVAGDPTATWKAENSAGTPSDVTLEGVDFTAHTLMALVKMSVELFEDAPNADRVVRDTIAKALALELDRVVLRGSGEGSEPTGIRNAEDVDVISLGTDGDQLTGYDDFSLAVEHIMTANHEPNAAIYAPRTAGTLDRMRTTEGQPLQPLPSFLKLSKFVTTQIPVDLEHGEAENATEVYIGDFSQVLVGVRTNLTLEVTRVAADSDGSAFRNLQVWVRAYLRADVQLEHDEAFSVITGVIPPAA